MAWGQNGAGTPEAGRQVAFKRAIFAEDLSQ